jgi:uroporphyrinogen-III decarboxylase
MDLAEDTPEVHRLVEMLQCFYIKEMEAWASTSVDALSFMDDWGSQRSLLISPKRWRQLFKPLYDEYARIAHGAGKKLFMHSDGYIFDIYEDLIEIGVDAVNSQLFIMDIEDIGRRFAGRITFWGEMDRQKLLVQGSVDEVRRAVRRVYESLYRDGGVIAQFEFGSRGKLELADAAFKAWEELGGSGTAQA